MIEKDPFAFVPKQELALIVSQISLVTGAALQYNLFIADSRNFDPDNQTPGRATCWRFGVTATSHQNKCTFYPFAAAVSSASLAFNSPPCRSVYFSRLMMRFLT